MRPTIKRAVRHLLAWAGQQQGIGLDHLIPPEIKNDEFYAALVAVAASPDVHSILEIGASGGEGSTEALVSGSLKNPSTPRLDCLEVSAVRFEALTKRWKAWPWIHCHRLSSVPVDAFPSVDDVVAFYRTVPSPLRRYPLEEILRWRDHDLTYLSEHGLSGHGIRMVKELAGITAFDAVLIDGSEFTGEAELDEVYGARYLMLDDATTYKNHRNYHRLRSDERYRLFHANLGLRNGFAIFVRLDSANLTSSVVSITVPPFKREE